MEKVLIAARKRRSDCTCVCAQTKTRVERGIMDPNNKERSNQGIENVLY